MPKIPLELTLSTLLIDYQHNCDRVNQEEHMDFQQALIYFQAYAHEILNQISFLRGPYHPDEYEVASTDLMRYREIIDSHIKHSHELLLILLMEKRSDAREIARHWRVQVSSRWHDYLENSRLIECVVSLEELRRRADIIKYQKQAAFFGINIATRLIFGHVIGEVAANASVAWVALENLERITASTVVAAALNTAAVRYIDHDANAYETFMQSAQKAFIFNTFNQVGHDVLHHAGQIDLEKYDLLATSITDYGSGAIDACISNSMGQPAQAARLRAANRDEVTVQFDLDLHNWVRCLDHVVENTDSITRSLSGSSLSFYSNTNYGVESESVNDINDVNYDFINDDGVRHRGYNVP